MFKKLFGGGKPAKGNKSLPKISSALENSIMGVVGQRSIPMMPPAAQRAFQLSTNPTAEARDFVEVIESDEALSARVVKIANSVFFDRGKKSNTIEEAVLVIGINELRCLLSATTLSEIFHSSSPMRTQMWSNDIATALISKMLAQRFLPEKADAAFLGGLMHDIGKLLLIQRSAEEYQKVVARIQDEGCTFSVAEEGIFPFTHTEAGQLIGERWRFSEELLEIIAEHHRHFPERSQDGRPSIVTIVKSADLIAHSFGWGHPRGFTKFQRAREEELPAVWQYLGVSAEEQRGYRDTLKRNLEAEYELYSAKQQGAA